METKLVHGNVGMSGAMRLDSDMISSLILSTQTRESNYLEHLLWPFVKDDVSKKL